MNNMIPVIVDEKNIGFIGVLIIILAMYVLYTLASIYIRNERYKKLLKAKELIEKGYDKKKMDKLFSDQEN